MGASRATLISEVEDSMRRIQGIPEAMAESSWAFLRDYYINVAAGLLLIVESGDRDAAEAEAQNQG